MEPVIELHNVSKKFNNNLIIENLSISISLNEVTAIVGKNGSGKSTLLKMIGGLIKPDTGKIHFHSKGHPTIGYVPETTPIVIPFTLAEYLTHMGKIRGLTNGQLEKQINKLLELFDMENERDIRIIHFSKGMKQKVAIMQAMLEETDLLIMDEPLSGLDQKAQADLEQLLITLKERGISIILTCHEMKLLEKVVDQILVIHERQVIKTNNQQRQEEFVNRIIFELPNMFPIEAFKNIIVLDREITNKQRVIELHVSYGQTNQVVKELLERGASIKLLEPLDMKGEELLTFFYRGEKT